LTGSVSQNRTQGLANSEDFADGTIIVKTIAHGDGDEGSLHKLVSSVGLHLLDDLNPRRESRIWTRSQHPRGPVPQDENQGKRTRSPTEPESVECLMRWPYDNSVDMVNETLSAKE
jgi:hypothetical protein